MATSATFEFSAERGGGTITWEWSEDRQVGQFCTGDWWVVGPITWNTVTRPQGIEDRDGSQYGPTNLGSWGTQGFDVRGDNITYNPSVNIANSLPGISVPVGSSIISSISRTEANGNNQLKYQAILTVLSSAPLSGSFRPFYGGTDRSILFNESDIDYGRMLSLPLVGDDPDPEGGLVESFRYPIITLGNQYPGAEYFVAQYNAPEVGNAYGAQFSAHTSAALNALSLNYTAEQKRNLAIGYLQLGLDTYGKLLNGGGTSSEGGHSHGHKAPFVFACHVFNDPAMQATCIEYGGGIGPATASTAGDVRFAEDQSTWYVTQNDIDQARDSGDYYTEPYTSFHLGMAEWGPGNGARDGYYRKEAGSNWGRTYRFNCFHNHVGVALIFHVMGLESLWNHQAFFDYTLGRYAVIEANDAPSPPRVNGLPIHTTNMLEAYGDATPVYPPSFSHPAGTYETTINVSLSTSTSGAEIYYTTNGTTPVSGVNIYTTPITISTEITLKAIAVKFDDPDSGVVSRLYLVDSSGKPAPPTTLVINSV